MFKLISVFILVLLSNFDLLYSSIVDETNVVSSRKETGLKDDNYVAVVSLGNGGIENAEYFIGVTEKEVILSEVVQIDEKGRKENLSLKRLDSRLLPDGFLLKNAESARLSYLPLNESALLCTDNIDNMPQCLVIPISSRPYSRLDPFSEITSDYRQKSPTIQNISNTFQAISDDGSVVVSAFLNTTYSRIIRQEFRKQNLITTGEATDHGLAKFKPPHQALENVQAFEYQGFAYVLRYAYRKKFIGDKSYEWVWQLTRVCMNDETKELRSRASIPLTCSFSTNVAESAVGWRPTKGYLDKKDKKLYLYVQPNVTYKNWYDPKEVGHRICSFDMNAIVKEFERTYNRCFNDYSHKVASHGGLFRTLTCNDFKPDASDYDYKCRYDICNPEECGIRPMYHLEVYEPLSGTLASVIDFRYQSDRDIEATQFGPLDMYVTSSTALDGQASSQAFIRNAAGSVFMVFVNVTASDRNTRRAPAWTNIDFTNEQHLLENIDHDGVQLIDNSQKSVSVFPADCDLYSRECQHLMDRATGEQARRWWGCGWCSSSTNDSYSASEKECQLANGIFYKDTCPARFDCYEPKKWDTNSNVSLEISGFFPSSFHYEVDVGGSWCKNVHINALGNSLKCIAFPPYSKTEPQSLHNIQISVFDLNNKSAPLFLLHPLCTIPQLPILPEKKPAVEGGPGDKAVWMVFSAASALVIIAVLSYFGFRMRRNRATKRQRNYDSLTLPMTVTVEMSQNNEYVVQRSVRGQPPNGAGPTGRSYEDLPDLVPRELLIRFESIELGSLVGQGHFGQVYKALYTPTGSLEAIPAAIKTLIGERNARQFLQEGIIMEQFAHPNVLSLIGISFNNDHWPMLVTPFMAKGDLLSYIRNPDNMPTVGQLLKFGVEIAEGMQYLHKLKFIHRDLAARNCMLDDNLSVKIADFGLSRDVYESECYLSSQNIDLPIRWMPPESIERREYSLKSDVWSYGVVVWELTTRGEVPYAGMSGFEVLSYLKSGRRLERPEHCPDPVYDIMRACWSIAPVDRPDFLHLSGDLPAAIREMETASDNELALVNSPTYYNLTPIVQQQQMLTSA